MLPSAFASKQQYFRRWPLWVLYEYTGLVRQLVAAADAEDELGKMRAPAQQRAAVGDEALAQGTPALEQPVGDIDHAGVGPGLVADVQQSEEGIGFPPWIVLRHQQGRRGRGARDSGMAVDQQMGDVALLQRGPEGENRRDMVVLGRFQPRHLEDEVVEAQELPAMGREALEGGGILRQGVEDREHVADPRLPVQRQLVDTADRDVVADQGTDHGLCGSS